MATQDYYATAVNGKAIPARSTRDAPRTEPPNPLNRAKPSRRGGNPFTVIVVTMCVCLFVIMIWQVTVIPKWTRYQEQLACGSGHVCKAVVSVAPGKQRMFLALIEDARVTVVELPDAHNSDSRVYLGAAISGDWQDMTLQIRQIPHNGYNDILLDAPEFQGADPVLYNHNGNYSWNS